MCPRVFPKLSARPRDGSEIKMLATQMQTPEFRPLAPMYLPDGHDSLPLSQVIRSGDKGAPGQAG